MKKLVSVRKLLDEDDERFSDTVVYMQSVADSSLAEDLSKYDFSYSQVLTSNRSRAQQQ